jgi:hypothetical protein
MCMRVPANILLRCLCQARTMFGSFIMCMKVPVTILFYVCAKPGQCSGHVYVHEGSSHYSIMTYVSSQANVRVMYICIRVPVSILLRCMCQARRVFGSCIGVCCFPQLLYCDVCAKPGQCSGHVYVYQGSYHYSIKMHVPREDSVRVMYMCMRVPATILLRCMYTHRLDSVRVKYMCMSVPATILLKCMCQASTLFRSCICV